MGGLGECAQRFLAAGLWRWGDPPVQAASPALNLHGGHWVNAFPQKQKASTQLEIVSFPGWGGEGGGVVVARTSSTRRCDQTKIATTGTLLCYTDV